MIDRIEPPVCAGAGGSRAGARAEAVPDPTLSLRSVGMPTPLSPLHGTTERTLGRQSRDDATVLSNSIDRRPACRGGRGSNVVEWFDECLAWRVWLQALHCNSREEALQFERHEPCPACASNYRVRIPATGDLALLLDIWHQLLKPTHGAQHRDL